MNATTRPLCPRRRDPAAVALEAGWASGPVWTGAGKSCPTGIRSPDPAGRSESLCRLSYRAQNLLSFPALFEVLLYSLLKIWFSNLFSSLAALVPDISLTEVKTKCSSNFPTRPRDKHLEIWTCRKKSQGLFKKSLLYIVTKPAKFNTKIGTGLLRAFILHTKLNYRSVRGTIDR